MSEVTVPDGVLEFPARPRIYERSEHNISRRGISEPALKVLYRLHKAGYQAYLVGGSVRDLLLERSPKDFDVATDAHPEQVRELFRNCRLIGRRFRLAHIRFGDEIIEVATFRAAHDTHGDETANEHGRILRDNVYGTLDDDVWRRDFTVNALYYNIADFSVVDYVNGIADLRGRLLRLIGDPEQRYREDPVRMLRAVRLAEKLDFTIEPRTAEPIEPLAHLLDDIAPARLFDEMLKLFQGGVAVKTLSGLRRHHLFQRLFPATAAIIDRDEAGEAARLIEIALTNTDRRIADGLPVTPAFLIAALLWPVMREEVENRKADGLSIHDAYEQGGDAVIARQVATVAIPRRIAMNTREIWSLQHRLEKRTPKRVGRILEQKRFRAAYDFLVMRAEVGEVDRELADWWTAVQDVPSEEQAAMVKKLDAAPGRRGAGKPRRRRRSSRSRRSE